MKSLYSILGISPDANASQVETAYAQLLSQLADAQGEDQRIRLIAIKEAYAVLSDPIKRQLYNQKLFAPQTLAQPVVQQTAAAEETGGFSAKKILLIGVLAIGGLSLYSYNAREREKLRIQHEHEVQMRAVQVLEASQQQSAAAQDAHLERQERIEELARARQEKADQEQFSRQVEMQRRENERAENARIQRERYEQQQAEARAEIERRRQVAEAERIARKEKIQLQNLERERYGRVITH